MFRRFQALKKGVETIKKVAPKLGTRKSDQIKKSNRMIKDLDKTLKKELGPKLRSEGEKLKKEVEKTRKEIYRSKMALGGILEKFKTKPKKPETKIKKGPMKAKPDNKGQKLTPEQTQKLKETFKEKKGIKEKILPKKKKDRLEELRKELKQEGGSVGIGMQAAPRKPQYITKKEKPKYITRKEKPKYITKKSKFITKKKKPVQSESKYITRKEKPKYITRKQKELRGQGRQLGGGPRD